MGTDSSMAISMGTPTSPMLRLIGEDRPALKLTLLPDRDPLNRPSFPFNR